MLFILIAHATAMLSPDTGYKPMSAAEPNAAEAIEQRIARHMINGLHELSLAAQELRDTGDSDYEALINDVTAASGDAYAFLVKHGLPITLNEQPAITGQLRRVG